MSSEATRGGAHEGQARPHALTFTMEGQVLERMAGTGATASGAGTTSARAVTRFRERPARSPAGRRHRLYERHPQGHDLKGHGQPDSRIRATGAGNDCDAFRSKGAGHQDGHREPPVDNGRRSASRRGARNRRDMRCVARGIAWRLMRLHFLIHNRMPVAPGVDVQQLGLWF